MDRKDDFNLDLDKYLSERRGGEPSKGFSFSLFSKKKESVVDKDDSGSVIKKIYGSVVGFFSSEKEADPIDIVELDGGGESSVPVQESVVDEGEVAEGKSSFFSRVFPFSLFSGLFSKDDELDYEYETEEVVESGGEAEPVSTINKVYLYKPVIKEEVKSVFLMTSDLIKKLPEREQLNLMNTGDYQLYLALMKRYKIK